MKSLFNSLTFILITFTTTLAQNITIDTIGSGSSYTIETKRDGQLYTIEEFADGLMIGFRKFDGRIMEVTNYINGIQIFNGKCYLADKKVANDLGQKDTILPIGRHLIMDYDRPSDTSFVLIYPSIKKIKDYENIVGRTPLESTSFQYFDNGTLKSRKETIYNFDQDEDFPLGTQVEYHSNGKIKLTEHYREVKNEMEVEVSNSFNYTGSSYVLLTYQLELDSIGRKLKEIILEEDSLMIAEYSEGKLKRRTKDHISNIDKGESGTYEWWEPNGDGTVVLFGENSDKTRSEKKKWEYEKNIIIAKTEYPKKEDSNYPIRKTYFYENGQTKAILTDKSTTLFDENGNQTFYKKYSKKELLLESSSANAFERFFDEERLSPH